MVKKEKKLLPAGPDPLPPVAPPEKRTLRGLLDCLNALATETPEALDMLVEIEGAALIEGWSGEVEIDHVEKTVCIRGGFE